jgi:hypothetical protein
VSARAFEGCTTTTRCSPGSAAKKRAREAHYIKGTAQINSKDSKAGGGSCFGDSGD